MKKGAIYTWGMDGSDVDKLLTLWRRAGIDTIIDLRRSSSMLANPPDTNAVGALYMQAREGRRILLVCSHADLRRCHRHEALALPIAQDAANYAKARRESKLALPVQPIDVKHVIGDLLVDPVEYQEALDAGRKPKGKRWR